MSILPLLSICEKLDYCQCCVFVRYQSFKQMPTLLRREGVVSGTFYFHVIKPLILLPNPSSLWKPRLISCSLLFVMAARTDTLGHQVRSVYAVEVSLNSSNSIKLIELIWLVVWKEHFCYQFYYLYALYCYYW